jgi:hypothetical protein
MKETQRDIIVRFVTRTGETQDMKLFSRSVIGLGNASPITPKSLNNPIIFTFVENNCGANVFMNKEQFEVFSEESLEVVVGALGLCKGDGPAWFEWGHGPNVHDLTAESMITCPITGDKNCHFWLEDSQGRVFDVIQPYIQNIVAKFHKKTIETDALFCNTLILAKNKGELEDAGLLYIPAKVEEQKKVVKHTLERIKIVPLK